MPTAGYEPDTWGEYSRLVLSELERHNRAIESISEKMSDLKAEIATRNELVALRTELTDYKSSINIEVATLKTKASAWGAVSGALAALLPIIMLTLFQIFSRKP